MTDMTHADLNAMFFKTINELCAGRIDLDGACSLMEALQEMAREHGLPFKRPSRAALQAQLAKAGGGADESDPASEAPVEKEEEESSSEDSEEE